VKRPTPSKQRGKGKDRSQLKGWQKVVPRALLLVSLNLAARGILEKEHGPQFHRGRAGDVDVVEPHVSMKALIESQV